MNINLISIFKKTIVENHRNYHKALRNALWTNKFTPKATFEIYP